MVDPVSIVTSVFSLTTAVLATAQKTKDFVDSIQRAPRAVINLSGDLRALSSVLETLNSFLNNLDHLRNPVQAWLVPILHAPLNSCLKALQDIDSALKPFVRQSGDARTSRWRGFLWNFREKEFTALQRNLASSQSVLDSAVGVVSLYVHAPSHLQP